MYGDKNRDHDNWHTQCLIFKKAKMFSERRTGIKTNHLYYVDWIFDVILFLFVA